LLFNFTLEHAIKKVKENQERLELNGTNRLVVYAEDANLLSENINTLNKDTDALLDARKAQSRNKYRERQVYTHASPSKFSANHNTNKSLENMSQF
jgi:hypothetical protein